METENRLFLIVFPGSCLVFSGSCLLAFSAPLSPIWRWLPDMHRDSVNCENAEITGYSNTQMLGVVLSDFYGSMTSVPVRGCGLRAWTRIRLYVEKSSLKQVMRVRNQAAKHAFVFPKSSETESSSSPIVVPTTVPGVSDEHEIRAQMSGYTLEDSVSMYPPRCPARAANTKLEQKCADKQ